MRRRKGSIIIEGGEMEALFIRGGGRGEGKRALLLEGEGRWGGGGGRKGSVIIERGKERERYY